MGLNVTEEEAEYASKENSRRQVVVSSGERVWWVRKIDWRLLLDSVVQSVEAIKSNSERERESCKEEGI